MKGSGGYSKRVGDTLWLHFEGRTYTLTLNDARGSRDGATKRSSNQVAHSGLLKSPMPGKVLKINFKVGDVVGQGQTICIIEAMKMEYALKAPFAGTIKEISKKAGEGVNLDEKIAQIEKT